MWGGGGGGGRGPWVSRPFHKDLSGELIYNFLNEEGNEGGLFSHARNIGAFVQQEEMLESL